MTLLIILAASYLYLVVVLLAGGTWLFDGLERRVELVKLGILAGLIALALAQIAALLYYDPRPFVVDHVAPLIAHANDNGFPSDHTLLAMTIAGVVFVYHRRMGYLLFALSAIVGGARVLAHVHHSIDIWGSTLLALIAIMLAWTVLHGVQAIDDFLTRILSRLLSKLPHR